MSTTFWIKKWKEYIEVAFSGNFWRHTRRLNELAELLPDDTKLKALDNTQQWINNIWDFKKALKKLT